jgi:hypothetical protein
MQSPAHIFGNLNSSSRPQRLEYWIHARACFLWSAACLKSTEAFPGFIGLFRPQPPRASWSGPPRCSIRRLESPVQQQQQRGNNNGPKGNSVFFFRMNKGAKAWTKKYRTEIAASTSSVLGTFAAFPLDFAKSRTVTLIMGGSTPRP